MTDRHLQESGMSIRLAKLIFVTLFAASQSALAQTQIKDPEWSFTDDFEGAEESFWSTSNTAEYGQPCPGDPSTGGALVFEYLASGAGSEDDVHWHEKRFRFPLEVRQLEMSYDLYVPENYEAPSQNHKSFVLWSGEYGKVKANISVSSENWGRSNGASPSVYIGEDGNNYGHVMNDSDPIMLVNHAGRWQRVHVYLELANSPGDYGRFEIYKNGEFLTGTHHPDIRDVAYADSPPVQEQIQYADRGNFIDQGYLLGWTNGAFSEKTTFCIDNFSAKASSVISETTTAPNPPDDVNVTIEE